MSEESKEPTSLEYIEDSYLPKLDFNITPSLDADEFDCDNFESLFDENNARFWCEEDHAFLKSLQLDQILSLANDTTEMQSVETEFVDEIANSNESASQLLNSIRKWRFLTRKKMRDVRVTFVDFSKPYILKISNNDNYKSFLSIGGIV
jgi:hypothetical protein